MSGRQLGAWAAALALAATSPAGAQERRGAADLRERVERLESWLPPEREEGATFEDVIAQALRDLVGRFRLTGYAVGSYHGWAREDSSLRALLPTHHFKAGDVSLHLRADLPHGFNAGAQVLFMPRPQDELIFHDEDFELERAYVQWAPVGQLRLTAGKWLTPVGYWTYLVHDEPLLPTLTTPLAIRNRIFDEESVGLLLEGEQPLGPVRLGYAAWVANGETGSSFRDDNQNKAVGGRLFVSGEGIGALYAFQVGVSAYTGLSEGPDLDDGPTDAQLERIALAEDRAVDFFQTQFVAAGYAPWGEPLAGRWNRAVAGDVVLDLFALRFKAEAMVNWVVPEREPSGLRRSNYIQWGAYAYLGVDLELPGWTPDEGEPRSLGHLEPYVRVDRYDANTDLRDELQSHTSVSVGLNYRVSEQLQVRVEGLGAFFRERSRDYESLHAGLVGSF